MCEATVAVDFRQVANIELTFGIVGLVPKATPLVKMFSSTPLAQSFAFTLGSLEYDGEFDLSLPTTQQFALDICENVVAETDLRVVPNRATCFLDDFDSWLRDGQDIYPNITGLPINDESDFTDLVEAFLDESDGDYDEVVGWDCASRTVRWLVLRLVTDIPTTLPAPQIIKHYETWDEYIGSLDAPPGVGTVLQVSDLWVTTLVLMLILSSTLESCMIAFGSSFLALCFFTGSARLAILATFTVLAIVLVLFGFMCGMMEWSFGAVEAVSIIIFVGYCVDFVLHVAQAYHRSTATIAVTARARSCTNRYDPRAAEERALRVRDALLESGSAIISAAVTTTFSSVFLLGCTIIVFNKMGLVVCVATIVSLTFTLIAFTSVLAWIGPPPPPPKEKKPSILRRLFPGLWREAASKVAVAADDSPTSIGGAGGWGESKSESQALLQEAEGGSSESVEGELQTTETEDGAATLAATLLQSQIRRKSAMAQVEKKKKFREAALRVQRGWRRKVEKARVRSELAERNATLVIRRGWRRKVETAGARAELVERRATRVIHRGWKRKVETAGARAEFAERKARRLIQRNWRRKVETADARAELVQRRAKRAHRDGVLFELDLLARRCRQAIDTTALSSRERALLAWRISRVEAAGRMLRLLTSQLEEPEPEGSALDFSGTASSWC